MKNVLGILTLAAMMVLVGWHQHPAEAAEKGKIRVYSDTKGAYIYANGKKKAMTGDGYTNILVPEGEYEVKVEKKVKDCDCVIRGIKKVFVGADTSVKLNITADLAGMEFVRIEPGTFMMGSPSDEPERGDNESQHKVTISKPFYMQTTEVTQGQWEAVMGNNPSEFKDCGEDCPVENVSWYDAQKFIKKLNRMTGNFYRLPTEAEWEYACRAGTTTPFYTGNCLSTNQANYYGDYPMPGCDKGKYRNKTVPVASFSPNPWGLYDMHGNVYEWCQDWYDSDYPGGHVTDPEGPSSGDYRVLRGGSWGDDAGYCRSANRGNYSPGGRNDDIGFRLVRLPGR